MAPDQESLSDERLTGWIVILYLQAQATSHARPEAIVISFPDEIASSLESKGYLAVQIIDGDRSHAFTEAGVHHALENAASWGVDIPQ